MFGQQKQHNAVYGMLFGDADPDTARFIGSARAATECEIIEIDVSVFDGIYVDDSKSQLKRKSIMTSPSELLDEKVFAQWVMRQHPSQRREDHVKRCAEYLVRIFEFLHKMEDEMVLEIIKCLDLVTLPQNHVVFKEKSVGTAFYMISKGSVSIEVMNADEEIGVETVATIGVGRSFGERAIESASSLREATIVTRSAINEFLVLKKDDYQKHVKKARQRELDNRIRLLKRNQELFGVPLRLLFRIAMKLDIKKIALGETLCAQGERCPGMYILARGQCVVSHSIYDTNKRRHVNVSMGEIGPGTLIGRYMFEDINVAVS